MNKQKKFTAKSLYLARFLMQNDIKLIKTEPNRDFPLHNVYVFDVEGIDLEQLFIQYEQSKKVKAI